MQLTMRKAFCLSSRLQMRCIFEKRNFLLMFETNNNYSKQFMYSNFKNYILAAFLFMKQAHVRPPIGAAFPKINARTYPQYRLGHCFSPLINAHDWGNF
jgi:hypothetical protein